MKDIWTKAAAAFSECLAGLRTRTQKAGVSEEQFGEVIESGAFLDKCSDLIVSMAQCLQLVTESIAVGVESFAKDSFFTNGPVKFSFWPNFTNWILSAIPETIPTSSTTLSSFTLTRNMSDTNILRELGNPAPFTISELAALLKGLLSKQPTGETGDLLTNNRYANIFYVLLEDGRLIAMGVNWRGDGREWGCGAYVLDGGDWNGGCRVFLPA